MFNIRHSTAIHELPLRGYLVSKFQLGNESADGESITMLVEYIQGVLEKAEYKILEDGTWFAEIPGFEGVWANGKTVEVCRKELVEVLEEWLVLKLNDGDPIPVVKGIKLNIKEVSIA